MNLKHWYIECKACGRRITLEIYNRESAIRNRREEKLECPTCRKEHSYSGADFKTAGLTV